MPAIPLSELLALRHKLTHAALSGDVAAATAALLASPLVEEQVLPGFSVVHAAVLGGSAATLRVLLEHGARLLAELPKGFSWERLWVYAAELGITRQGVELCKPGVTPLRLAVALKQTEAVEALLAHGACGQLPGTGLAVVPLGSTAEVTLLSLLGLEAGDGSASSAYAPVLEQLELRVRAGRHWHRLARRLEDTQATERQAEAQLQQMAAAAAQHAQGPQQPAQRAPPPGSIAGAPSGPSGLLAPGEAAGQAEAAAAVDALLASLPELHRRREHFERVADHTLRTLQQQAEQSFAHAKPNAEAAAAEEASWPDDLQHVTASAQQAAAVVHAAERERAQQQQQLPLPGWPAMLLPGMGHAQKAGEAGGQAQAGAGFVANAFFQFFAQGAQGVMPQLAAGAGAQAAGGQAAAAGAVPAVPPAAQRQQHRAPPEGVEWLDPTVDKILRDDMELPSLRHPERPPSSAEDAERAGLRAAAIWRFTVADAGQVVAPLVAQYSWVEQLTARRRALEVLLRRVVAWSPLTAAQLVSAAATCKRPQFMLPPLGELLSSGSDATDTSAVGSGAAAAAAGAVARPCCLVLSPAALPPLLAAAVAAANLAAAALLLGLGASAAAAMEGVPLLVLAATTGSGPMLRLLRDAGAPYNMHHLLAAADRLNSQAIQAMLAELGPPAPRVISERGWRRAVPEHLARLPWDWHGPEARQVRRLQEDCPLYAVLCSHLRLVQGGELAPEEAEWRAAMCVHALRCPGVPCQLEAALESHPDIGTAVLDLQGCNRLPYAVLTGAQAPPPWSPALHMCYPRPFRAAARTLLLAAHRSKRTRPAMQAVLDVSELRDIVMKAACGVSVA